MSANQLVSFLKMRRNQDEATEICITCQHLTNFTFRLYEYANTTITNYKFIHIRT